MTQRLIKWLAIGLFLPIVVILATVQSTVGIPSITSEGMHWSTFDYAGWRANGITVSFNNTVQVDWVENIQPLSTESTNEQTANAHTPNFFANRIESVEIDNLIVHHGENSYDTGLNGTVYPTIALTNDWLSVGRTDEAWLVSGTVDSTSDEFTDSPLQGWLPKQSAVTFMFSASITDLDAPIEGALQQLELTHPLLGTTMRIPALNVSISREDLGWTGMATTSAAESELEWRTIPTPDHPTQADWAINYTIALQDLTNWFNVVITDAMPLGYWTGTITPREATITGAELGFEGQLYGVYLLENGYPITYLPIHSSTTRSLGPNLPNWTPYSKMGWLAKAVIAGEDASFFTHDGFNEEGLTRALNELYKEVDNPIGGSSITQQVAKNLFSGNRATLDRKVEEMVYTLGLEAAISKEAILALYLNSIEFGDKIYGITEACNQYFLKKPEFLTVKEAVFLASILPNPRSGYKRSKLGRPPTRRMRAILENLVAGKHITRKAMNDAIQEPLRLLLPVE